MGPVKMKESSPLNVVWSHSYGELDNNICQVPSFTEQLCDQHTTEVILEDVLETNWLHSQNLQDLARNEIYDTFHSGFKSTTDAIEAAEHYLRNAFFVF